MKHQWRILLGGIYLSLHPQLNYAMNQPDLSPQVIMLSFGPGWPMNTGNAQTFFLQPYIEKTYTAPKSNRTLIEGAIFAGWQKAVSDHFMGQAGIAFGASSDASLNGYIWEDADPDFNNFKYRYTISHYDVSLAGKLLATKWQQWMPYVNGSIGVGFNRSANYVIEPLIVEEVPAPSFNAKSTTAFTYTVGAGIQRPINKYWQAGVGYTFSDWGRSKLSEASGQTLNNTPGLSHLYVNSLMFNLTYLR